MDGGQHPYLGIVLLIAFIFVDSILYCFRSALINVNEKLLVKNSEDNPRKAKKVKKILNLIEVPYKLENTIDITVFITNVFVGAYIIEVISKGIINLTKIQDAKNVWITYAVAVVILIILIVAGVLVPKRVGLKYPEKSVLRLYGIASFLMIIFTPIVLIVTCISNLVLRLIGINPKEDLENLTEDEIITMVNEGQEQGVLEDSEVEMITNIFEFGDKQARDVMIRRSNIVAIDGNSSLEEAFKIMLSNNYSRYPVYEQDVDNIIGIIYLRDATIAYENEKSNETHVKNINKLLRKPYFIPETRNIDILFKDMQTKRSHVAIVVDEYGQTSGLITMEDIIEEIMGNILDEYDEEEELIEKTAEDSYEVDGLTLLEDIEDLLGIEFEDDEYETLNGFIISCLHRIPSENEDIEVEYSNYNFKALEVQNKVIKKIRITKIKNQEVEGNDGEA